LYNFHGAHLITLRHKFQTLRSIFLGFEMRPLLLEYHLLKLL